jgi:hypothetical protein
LFFIEDAIDAVKQQWISGLPLVAHFPPLAEKFRQFALALNEVEREPIKVKL